MENKIIADDIYKDSLSLTESSYYISGELYEETRSLDEGAVNTEICNSYKFSERYWVWRIGAYTYRKFWKNMLDKEEMWLDAPGLKYFNSYPTLAALESAYEKLHPDRRGITTNPSAYYTFANYLKKGDVVIVDCLNEVVGWGMVESYYMYRPTRETGCHYRKMSWHEVKMPFIFTSKRPAIYQIAKEETKMLKETLINNVIRKTGELPLPFDFVSSKAKCI